MSSIRGRPRLPTVLPALTLLTFLFTGFEAMIAGTMREPAMGVSAIITGGLAMALLSAWGLVRRGDELHATWVAAAGVAVAGILGGYLVQVSQVVLLLPVLSVALLLPYASGRQRLAVVVFGIGYSAATFVAISIGRPMEISEPLGTLYSGSIILTVAMLIIAALLDFAGDARRSMADVVALHQRQAVLTEERLAIVSGLVSLEPGFAPAASGETLEETARAVAHALGRLPGVSLASVLEVDGDDLRVLGIWTATTFGVGVGELIPAARSREILAQSDGAAWSERFTERSTEDAGRHYMEAIGVRVAAYAPMRSGGKLLGLVAIATSDAAWSAHLTDDLPAVSEFAATAAALLGPGLLLRRDRLAKRREILDLIETRGFRPVFQPILDLTSNRRVGFEALTQFRDAMPPAQVFAAARESGCGLELESATLQAAVRASRALPRDAFLSLNVSPALVTESATIGRLLPRSRQQIVLEITEHEAIPDYPLLRAAAHDLGPDVSLAVDDAGAGVANFNHLVELRPAFVKIDIAMVRNVHLDLPRQAMIVGLAHFANTAECTVIVEGLETRAERNTVMQLGVGMGQGYLLGRPAPASTFSARTELRRAATGTGAQVGGQADGNVAPLPQPTPLPPPTPIRRPRTHAVGKARSIMRGPRVDSPMNRPG